MPHQTQAGAQSIDDQKEIIAALCVGAPSDNIRNCLRKYDPTKPVWQIEKDLKKDKKDVLVDSLLYLGVPGMNQYRHDALPHELVCRVQNLLPDTCSLCKQNYCISLEDKPILSCVKCGQGCHNSCVLQIIGRTVDELNEENNFGESLANPYAALGLFYVCGGCQEDTIPNKSSLKIKQGQTSRRTSLSEDQPPNIPLNIGTQADLGSNVPTNTQNERAPPAATEEVLLTGQSGNTRNRNNTPTNNQTSSSVAPICTRFKTGRCSFGISGKKDGTCPYRHPKPCTKFLINGNRSRGGCRKGTNCNLFHPSMCYNSMRERQCFRENCKFMHIKGTKRSEDEATGNQGTYPPAAQQNQTRKPLQPQPRSNSQNQSHNPSSNSPFLDMMKSMQDQISQLSSKLQQMDTNYHSLCYQQLGYPPHMRFPLPMQAHQLMKPPIGQMGSMPYPNQTVNNSLGLQPAH